MNKSKANEYKQKQLVLDEYAIWIQEKEIKIGNKISFFTWLLYNKPELLDFIDRKYAFFSLKFHNDIP